MESKTEETVMTTPKEKIEESSIRERKKEAWGQFLNSLQAQDFLKILKNLKRSEIYKTQTVMISEKEEILNIYDSLLQSEGATDFLSENWSAQEIVFLLWIGYAFYIKNKNLNLYSLNFKIWDEIAKLFPTSKNCHQLSKKWKMIKINKSKKDFWTPEEDEALRDLIINKWTLVANMINTTGGKNQGNRTAKQCRERWINYLDPKLNKEPWTAAEDIKLLNLTIDKKKRWIKISKSLEGRTENAVKNRFNSLMNKIKKAINTLSDMNKELPPESDPRYERALISTLLKIKENDLRMSDNQSQSDSGHSQNDNGRGDDIFLKNVINTSLEEFLKIKRQPDTASQEKILKKSDVKVVHEDTPKPKELRESNGDSRSHNPHYNYQTGDFSSDDQMSPKSSYRHGGMPPGYVLAGTPSYMPLMAPRIPMTPGASPVVYPGYVQPGYTHPYYLPPQHSIKTDYSQSNAQAGYSPTSPHNSNGHISGGSSASTETPTMKNLYSNPSSPGYSPYYSYMPGVKNPCLMPADNGLMMPGYPMNPPMANMGYGMAPYPPTNYYPGMMPYQQMYPGAEHMESMQRGGYQMGGSSPLGSNYYGNDGK